MRGGGSASEGAAGTLDRRRSRVVDRDCTGAGAGSAGGGGGGASSSWSAVTSSAAVRAARAAARAACACPGDVSAAAAAGSHTKGLFLALPSTRQRLCPSAPNFTVPCTYKWAAAAGGSVVFWRFTDAASMPTPQTFATQRIGGLTERVSTPTSPPTRAPCDPSDATTCVPSDAYLLGVTRRPSGACSAST